MKAADLDKVSMQSVDRDVQAARQQTKLYNHDLSCVWDYGQRGWEARFFLRHSLSDGLSNDKKVSSTFLLSYLIHRLSFCR
jgi:hypothetical protein